MENLIKTLSENTNFIIASIGILLAISELLSYTKLKSNGNLQLITNILKRIKSFLLNRRI